MSSPNFCFLTCIKVSQEAGKVVWRWSGIFISLRIFQFVVTHAVNETEVDVFLKLSCLFYDLTDVGNLISGSFAFSKSNLNIWKFLVHVLLKPGFENFEHYFVSMWDECNCVIVWTSLDCFSLGLEWKLTFSSPMATAVKWYIVKSLSRVRFFVTAWTVAYQAPLSMGFSRQ